MLKLHQKIKLTVASILCIFLKQICSRFVTCLQLVQNPLIVVHNVGSVS